ncbi:3-hydroxybutyryl-CoA dehydrogenase [Facklamia sp. DSM 111018]|uniref:3-hydroxyacyl-CoA dehydrogenase n=1 Tax=Facklamia lactis TaxID=2749967 RepID=A0ABS0LQ86_9LACT|nr:3-hydroxybutyryl-CoA dehydrogenase [Facklamia lactis]MBG9980528.1 3-hydroxybutyryl-CoA dehydrogenase [Facklamia lactis]MBG9986320.1 3-hydroxybutyryl-CoA dehydrogenase [Facklamia lactis]
MDIKKIMIIGAGQMGAGIAQVFAQAGYEIILNDIKEEFVEKGISGIEKGMKRRIEKGKMEESVMNKTLSLISPSTNYSDAQNADLVIEAATENESIKLDIFKQLDEFAPEHTILATNTSSLSITKIAAATNRPDKVAGFHFFNPVPVMNLIEVNLALQTSNETKEALEELGKSIDKTVIIANDTPGFVVNRLLIPMINEAIFILESGTVTAESIDKAMELGANHPMGPLSLADLIGLDTVLAIMETLYKGFKDQKYRPSLLLTKYVEAGKLGRKTGEGFFKYD